MKPKTSPWVAELLDTWLKDITDNDVLDQFIKQIQKRKAELYRESEAAAFERLWKTYKDLKIGDVVWTIKPLCSAKSPKGNPWKWHKAKFNKFFPRKKAMYLQVPWKTKIKQHGKYFIYLTHHQLKSYQPSRTEPDVRERKRNRSMETAEQIRRGNL
jgi:hypothetical protein